MSTHISKNIFWLTASRVLALLMLFLAYRALLPYFGPFGTGQYFYIQSYVLLFSTVVDFGVQQFITKKISEQPERAKEYFQKFFSFEIVVAVVLYILLVGIASMRHYDHAVFFGICVAGLGMFTNALTYPYLAVMAAFQDMRKVAWMNFLNSCVNFTLIMATVLLRKYIVFLSSVTFVFGIMDLILYWHFVKKHIPKPEVLKGIKLFDFGLIRGILKQAWPFTLLVGFSAIYNRVDVVIITFLKGYTQTGLYTTAYRIFDLLNFFPAVVSYTLFPFFTGLMAKKAILEVRENLEKYVSLMLALALPMAVGGMILSLPLIGLLTSHDPRYAYSAVVLSILIWAPAIQFVYIPANSLVISQLTKQAMAITGANVIINIAGNLILIPHFGIRAAAFMTVVSESLQGIFYFYFIRKGITDFKFFSLAFKPALAAIIMGLVLWPLRNYNLFLSLPVGAVSYFVILIATGFIKKDDWNFIKSFFAGKQSA
ncbi:MAG: flippase [Candidatus Doudnabacteria bacterium]|nr:flippase [Candidatus Doudnabacteria bacterium]